MAGNNAEVTAGYPSIGVTDQEKITLYQSAGFSDAQAKTLVATRDYLSMPREEQRPVVDVPYPKEATVVPKPQMSEGAYYTEPYPTLEASFQTILKT